LPPDAKDPPNFLRRQHVPLAQDAVDFAAGIGQRVKAAAIPVAECGPAVARSGAPPARPFERKILRSAASQSGSIPVRISAMWAHFRCGAGDEVGSMPFSFEETKLWRNVFASGEYTEEKRRIRQSYCSFWQRTCELAKFIASDLPGLTLHDERHFEALWQRADQIAGDGYFLNPMELFAFGGGILLHDAGLTLAAYPGGLDELRQTLEWRDAAALMEPTAEETAARTTTHMAKNGFLSADTEIQFEVLRQLHGSRAEELADLTLVLPDSSDSLHLIEDESLRRHLGPTMGQIAASHHWDLHILERKLPREIGAVGGFPPDWTIRPIVLACLLRCADAAQIDQQRAPDFSYALLRGNRDSEKHWRAQNRLAQPFVTGDALTYTSTRVFGRDDAQAWWLAADALLLIST
jgi:hypothetical protein